MKKISVLCIDPGYSLIEALDLFNKGNYPGHCLYGINHLDKEIIYTQLQPKKTKSGRIRNEIYAVRDYFKLKPDVIYLTFSDYGILLSILRKIGLVKCPVIGLMHGYLEKTGYENERKKTMKKLFVNCMRKIEVWAMDKPIFISEYGYRDCCKKQSKYKHKIVFHPLQPEITEIQREEINYDLVSIGKTMREYETLEKVVEQENIKTVVVGSDIRDKDKIHVVNNRISYRESLAFYQKSRIILVPVKESGGGIYGLSSILDALAVKKPVLCSRTMGLGIDVEGLNLGRTYEIGDCQSFKRAYLSIEKNYNKIISNIEHFTEMFNIYFFSNRLSKEIRDVVTNEYDAKKCSDSG